MNIPRNSDFGFFLNDENKKIDWERYEKLKQNIFNENSKFISTSDLVRLFLTKDSKSKRKITNFSLCSSIRNMDSGWEELIYEYDYYVKCLSKIFRLQTGWSHSYGYIKVDGDRAYRTFDTHLFICDDASDCKVFLKHDADQLDKYISPGKFYGYPDEYIQAFRDDNKNSKKLSEMSVPDIVNLYIQCQMLPESTTVEELLDLSWKRHDIIKDWDQNLAERIEEKF